MKIVNLFMSGGQSYGLERTVFTRLNAFAEAGLDFRAVVIAEMRAGGLPPRTQEALDALGRPYHVIPTRSRLPLGVAWRFQKILRRFPADVIHSDGYKADAVSVLVRSRALRVSTVHGWCSRSVKERAYEWIGLQCQKRMDAVVVLCEEYRRRLLARGVSPHLIRVIGSGIDPASMTSHGRDLRSEWGIKPGEVVVAQVGRLSPEKNPSLFIEAAQRLAERCPQARFVLVGDGPQQDELSARAARLGSHLRLAGYFSEVADVYRASDVVVNCSTTEGLPGVLLEAGAFGVPCVGTNVGGVSEIIADGRTGFVCPSRDAAAIVTALARLIGDADLRRSMGAAARERISALFHVRTCSRQLAATYSELLALRQPVPVGGLRYAQVGAAIRTSSPIPAAAQQAPAQPALRRAA